jgi:hypothetical protein
MKELNEFDYFKAWLLFFVIATGGGLLASLVLGSFLAAFLGAGGASLAGAGKAVSVLGFIVGVPISYVTFRGVVGKYLIPKLEED